LADGVHKFDVLVVGGGPAGIAAAACAAESGLRVGLADDNLSLGGQIWRGEEQAATSTSAAWFERLKQSYVEYLRGYRIFAAVGNHAVLAETLESHHELRFEKLILATGARERFLPFPGWTLPNVMGAGGLQALVKSGLPIAGRRVVIAGTGPLLLAVAAHLQQAGAEVCVIAEQAGWARLVRFGMGLAAQPAKLAQALSLRRELRKTRFVANCWPVAAEGEEKLESVTLRAGSKTWKLPCDYLACGFHLVPNVELAVLLGAVLDNGFVRVDEWQQTTVPNVYCAGEPTGIGGLELSLVEGQIAGYAVAGLKDKCERLLAERRSLRKFAQRLERAFTLRDELRMLPNDETFVCRCEDVSLGRLREHKNWRSAKLHTRCGMGPCQGRICGPAVEFLLDCKVESVRPPVFPVRLESLAGSAGISSDT
jgi:NADPH-dependent 2,4-dienoyl-CoA reductase/sulfur reductase-like enzyme